jgi:hypothetical protein
MRCSALFIEVVAFVECGSPQGAILCGPCRKMQMLFRDEGI